MPTQLQLEAETLYTRREAAGLALRMDRALGHMLDAQVALGGMCRTEGHSTQIGRTLAEAHTLVDGARDAVSELRLELIPGS